MGIYLNKNKSYLGDSLDMQRNTVQRELVLEAVNQLRHHPTAEDIYRHIACTRPSVSRATVYRNLALLARQGAVRRVSHLNAADRFDFNLEPHYHFLCKTCGQVFDVALPYRPELSGEVGGGFVAEEHDITFAGVCPACGREAAKQQ
jgi:Fe2+ or Zn2+ uptake regulation protein